jgi:hypothetical protein
MPSFNRAFNHAKIIRIDLFESSESRMVMVRRAERGLAKITEEEEEEEEKQEATSRPP